MDGRMSKLILSLVVSLTCCLGGVAQAAPAEAARSTPTLEGQPCLSQATARDCQQGAAENDSENEENKDLGKPGNPVNYDAAAAPVPEPQTFLMMLIGLVLLGFNSKRRHSEKFAD